MELSVLGLNVKVLKKNNLINKYGIAGSYNFKSKDINIDNSLKADNFNQCLIHELIHATFDRIGIINTNLDANLEEIICDNIATVIVENFKLKIKKKEK